MSINQQHTLKVYKLGVIGNDGVGKATLIDAFVDNATNAQSSPSKPGTVSTRRCILDGEEIIIDITNGGESDEDCIRNSQGLIIVYSIAARSTFDAVSQLCYKIVEVKGVTAFSGIVAGNGSDLKYERQVGMNEGHDVAKHFALLFTETSAKLGLNVEDVFYNIVRVIRDQTKADE